jgi:hypothetical protein
MQVVTRIYIRPKQYQQQLVYAWGFFNLLAGCPIEMIKTQNKLFASL